MVLKMKHGLKQALGTMLQNFLKTNRDFATGEQPAAMQRSGSALMMNASGHWWRLALVSLATLLSSLSVNTPRTPSTLLLPPLSVCAFVFLATCILA